MHQRGGHGCSTVSSTNGDGQRGKGGKGEGRKRTALIKGNALLAGEIEGLLEDTGTATVWLTVLMVVFSCRRRARRRRRRRRTDFPPENRRRMMRSVQAGISVRKRLQHWHTLPRYMSVCRRVGVVRCAVLCCVADNDVFVCYAW